jgi:hypothetical protein
MAGRDGRDGTMVGGDERHTATAALAASREDLLQHLRAQHDAVTAGALAVAAGAAGSAQMGSPMGLNAISQLQASAAQAVADLGPGKREAGDPYSLGDNQRLWGDEGEGGVDGLPRV